VRNDGKGRHTTTNRSLFLLPCGSLVIDNPGLREVGVMMDEFSTFAISLDDITSSLEDDTFSDIDALSKDCSFRDCKHVNEPGCAVIKAVEDGELPRKRLENYHKIISELNGQRKKLWEKRKDQKKQGKFSRRFSNQSMIKICAFNLVLIFLNVFINYNFLLRR
jgi:ribosome biogenesis GTPase